MPKIGEPFNPYGWWDGIYVPNWLYRRSELSDGAKLLYARLMRFTAKGGTCRPSQEYLARDMNRTDRTIRRQLTELENQGLLQSRQRGLNQANIYVFLWHDWMEDEGTWYPHDDAMVSTADRTKMSGPDRTDVTGHDRTDVSGPLPYEQERVSKRLPSRGTRERKWTESRPDENLPDDEARPAKRVPASSPSPGSGSGAGLARLFRGAAKEAFSAKELGPGPFNDKALARTLVTWMREDGVTAEEIRKMIQLFCLEPLPVGKTPWVGFVGARTRLLAKARKVAVQNQPAHIRYALD